MFPIRIKACSESDLRMLGNLARNIQRVLPVTQADIDAAAALGKGWVVWKVIEVNDPIDNLRGGTQLVIKQNSIQPGQNVRRVLIVSGPGGETVVVSGSDYIALPDAIANSLQYVKAFGGTKQGLPDGYTQLEYVVFDSTQIIDTGFTPDNNSRIESKCYRTSADCWFYGAGPTNPRITLYHSSTGTCRWGNQSRSNVGFVADTEYIFVQDKNGININGVDVPWTAGTADDFTCDRSLTIGNCNGATGTRYFAGNLYYIKIYDNDVLARDLVPCKNASNVVGLYDRVNGVFYTDTGLVAGPGAVPTPDAPMDIVCNNGVLKASGNLLNPNAPDYGNYTINVDGTYNYANDRITTGFIPVIGGNTLTVSTNINVGSINGFQFAGIAEYDANKQYITRTYVNAQPTLSVNLNSNTSYVRVFEQFTGISNVTPALFATYQQQLEVGSTATPYIPYGQIYTDGVIETIKDSLNNTATTEMLLKIGDYQDVQSILDGAVTRNVVVKVLDGTEDWQNLTGYINIAKTDLGTDSTVLPLNSTNIICSHFETKTNMGTSVDCIAVGISYVNFKYDSLFTTVAQFKQYLADQYAAGTPVIVIYPLATPTTESVAGQALQVQDGDNTLEITQASLSGLELEAEYTKAA